ncbi:MAG: hypothetical protein ACUVV4_05870 [Candidatus Bathyarchaeia archaeon]
MEELNIQESLGSQQIGELRIQSAKLDQIISKLKNRDRALFRMCEEAVRKTDKIRARMYANEIAKVRELVKAITQSQLAIECVLIRLENFIELHGLINELKPISKMIQTVSSDVSKVMPGIASEVQQLNYLVSDTLMETKVDFSQPALESLYNSPNESSEAILKEVSEQLEKRLVDSLPVPPSISLNAPSQGLAPKMIAEAIPVSHDVGIRKEKSPEAVRITQASSDNIVLDDFMQVLDELSAKSKAKLEECMA